MRVVRSVRPVPFAARRRRMPVWIGRGDEGHLARLPATTGA